MRGSAPAPKEALEKPTLLLIHHTDIPDRAEQAQMVDQSHQRRGYDPSSIINPATGVGWHIAYHYLIGKDGTVLQTRAHAERTQHTSCGLGLEKCVGVQKVNDHSLAIVLAGNFEHEQPTPQQLAALKKLVKELDAQYRFKRIMTHRDASPTSCPGDNLVNAVQDLVRKGEPEKKDEKKDVVWQVTRYYTPVENQQRYYRDSYEADFKVNCSGDCLVTADGYRLKPEDAFKVAACPKEYAFGTRFEIEGIGTVTCHDRGGAIKITKTAQGEVIERRLDVWAGVGGQGLTNILTTKGGPRKVRVLP